MILGKVGNSVNYNLVLRVAVTKETNKGRLAPPNTRSVNAIFITRYKLFLFRSFLLNVKRTIVSKFPRTITTASDARAQLQAMTCASESISSMAEKELLSDEVEADIFFVIVPAIALISRNVTLKVYEKQRRRLFKTAGPQNQPLL